MSAWISGNTRLAGVLGWPLAHTLSPAIHNAAYQHMKLDWVYLPLALQDARLLTSLLDTVRALPFIGFNVTMPYKESVLRLCDEVSEFARLAGSVNAVQVKGDVLVGYNSDGRGLLESLREETAFDPKGTRIAIIGAGGAAGSALMAFALASASRVTLVNRTPERAERMLRRLEGKTSATEVVAVALDSPSAADEIGAADLVVNATPVGMSPKDPSPVPGEWLKKEQVVADMVYRPRETAFLRAAKQVGGKPVGGLGMLVNQAAITLETWVAGSRVSVPREVMRQAAELELGRLEGQDGPA